MELRMYERMRRLACRWSWAALCVCPTILIAAWCAYRHTPIQRAQAIRGWQEVVSHRTGFEVLLGGVREARPRHVQLRELQFVDPETSVPVLRCDLLETAWDGDRCVMLAHHVEALQESLPELLRQLHGRILRGTKQYSSRVELIINQLRLPSASAELTLEDFQATWFSSDAGPRVDVEFRRKDAGSSEPVRIAILRDRQHHPPITSWTLDSSDAPLPCSSLRSIVPSVEWLGEEATFQGLLSVTHTETGPEVTVQGRLSKVDLDALVFQPFSQRCTGLAEVVLNRVEWRSGKIAEAAGEIDARDGEIGRSLIMSLASPSGLRLERVSRLERAAETRFTYRQLAFGFRLNGAGVLIRGNCQAERPGVVLRDGAGPLLLEAGTAPVPLAGLLRTLQGERGTVVPASAELDEFSRILPAAIKESGTTTGSISNGKRG